MFDWPTETMTRDTEDFCPSDHITVKVRISTSRTPTLAKIASDRSDPPARGPSPPRQFSTREVWLGLFWFSKATRSWWKLCSYGTYLKQKSWMLTSYQLYINSNIYYTFDVCSKLFSLFFWRRDLGETPHSHGLYVCLIQTRLHTFHAEPLPTHRWGFSFVSLIWEFNHWHYLDGWIASGPAANAKRPKETKLP